MTKREHLEQVAKQVGFKPEELKGPEFPELVSHVWSSFLSLSNSRTNGFSGPNPITYEQIKAWKDLTNNVLSARDIDAIMRIDRVFMRVTNG